MATTVTKRTFNLRDTEPIIVDIAFDGTDATEEVDLGANYKIHHIEVMEAYGANAGHTEQDLGQIEIDETVGSDGTFEAQNVTVNRFKTVAAATLADQDVRLVFYVSGPIPA